ncbi:MAG TPA: DNA polymerase III subunit alpha [Candidatus Saccharimonadia bacterium]|nr:DNA polymerase III subunit alpha [Candidatus Saccharimonadia bacterium]
MADTSEGATIAKTVGEEQADSAAAQFVHLHNHSHYSLLDGLQKVPAMLDRIQELGMTAVALTDHGTLSGTVEFYKEAKSRGLKPIIGVETYVAPRGHLDKAGRQDLNPYHLILLAETTQGYHNLMKLVTIAQLDGFYQKPRIDRELLAQYHEGLIALSGCAGGEVAQHIEAGNLAQAEAVAGWYDETFGRGNYFLELQAHEHQWDHQKMLNAAKIELSKQTGIPVVVTADSHYSRHENRQAHETLLCVQTGKTLDDTNRMTMDMDLYLTSPEEIMERFAHVPEAYQNTVKIAERCEVDLDLGRILIPTFPVPEEGLSERDYLHKLCWQGLAWRYAGVKRADTAKLTEAEVRGLVEPVYAERLDYELGIIGRMGYEGYFLMTADLINWGKDQGIIFGPGRGSAAGSIVAYTMNITDLDPIKYDLLFERFLNPDRVSMPDIDIDIQDTRRGEVIEYVTGKYGSERVSQIITFGTMAARNAVRDTGRVLGMSYAEVDAIAKLVPQPVQGRHVPLAVSIGLKSGNGSDEQRADPELVREYQSNPRAKKLIDLAMELEGTIRNNGVHAAGVVIAPAPIVDYIPLQRAQKGMPCTMFSMGYVEEVGLLKMDFLGLSNLTIINNALVIIKRVYDVDIDLGHLPLDDKPTFELLARGDTTGVFQLESAGMKRYLRELKPTVFDDIIAMAALYRPGPMQFIDGFIDRKHGRAEISYFSPKMEAALKMTYGVLVYQEQVMQIAKDMCGFTGGQADTLRKGVAKKKPEVLAKLKTDFIEGAVTISGADRAKMEEFWGQLEAFAAYCFPKAHAACYALIAYQTAYLKAHYPAAFMAALMTSDFGDTERIAKEIGECRSLGIPVLPPDVNESFQEFAVVKESGSIRFGLAAIKNVGTGAIEAILRAREEGGKFTSMEDFAKRVSARECNKKVWESLAKCGAFDSLSEGNRGQLLHNLDLLTAYAAKVQKNALSGQTDIFGSLGVDEEQPALRLELPSQPVDAREQLMWEKELLGLYLSHHPLDDYAAYLADHCQPLGAITAEADGKLAKVGGFITTVRKITTKNGATMAFVGIEDRSGTNELIVFPKAYEASPHIFEADQVIVASGKISARDREGRLTGEPKILLESAKVVDYDTAKAYVARPGAKPPAMTTAPVPSWQKQPAAGAADRGVARPAARPAAAPPALSTAPGDPAAGSLVLRLADPGDQALLLRLKELLGAHPGPAEAYAVLGADTDAKKIRLPFKVTVSDALTAQLGELLGADRVRNRQPG